MKIKTWKSIHSYVGLIAGLLLVAWGATGFVMMDHEMMGLKHVEVESRPFVWWYETMPEEKEKEEEREKVEYLTFYTEEGEPVQVASDHGQVLVRMLDETAWTKSKESDRFYGAVIIEENAVVLTKGKPIGMMKEKHLTWGKVVDDLHTGKFFAGRLDSIYQIGAVSLVGLTLSGIWLWYVPWRAKRQRTVKKAVVVCPNCDEVLPDSHPHSHHHPHPQPST